MPREFFFHRENKIGKRKIAEGLRYCGFIHTVMVFFCLLSINHSRCIDIFFYILAYNVIVSREEKEF